jgi:5-methylcytosine-specific restriction endonuclease McrBC GTP-binding regulatory subunit McrB
MIKVCVVGTHQSGSTRLFNLVRLIYEKKGKSVYSNWAIEKQHLNNNYDVILSKIHDTSMDYLNDYNIKLLPLRNFLDSAISARKRMGKNLISHCENNINLFNKFKSKVDFIFKYECYSVYYIKKLCDILNVVLNNNEIIQIMAELDRMHNNSSIVLNDDHSNDEYRKTLLSQNHNTSNGKSNKFINLNSSELDGLLKNEKIVNFLNEQNYF